MNDNTSKGFGGEFGNIPDINPDTAGTGSKMVDGVNVVYSIPKDEVDTYTSKTPVPTYQG